METFCDRCGEVVDDMWTIIHQSREAILCLPCARMEVGGSAPAPRTEAAWLHELRKLPPIERVRRCPVLATDLDAVLGDIRAQAMRELRATGATWKQIGYQVGLHPRRAEAIARERERGRKRRAHARERLGDTSAEAPGVRRLSTASGSFDAHRRDGESVLDWVDRVVGAPDDPLG
ncbi:MAG: hypothetical protein ACYCS4_07760 [Acidimicrobiales bacterium]